jgi:hypothetical protein
MLIPRESDTMHVFRIRLSVAVLQGLDGSGLGGTFSSQHIYLQSTQPISGEEIATGDGLDGTRTQQEDAASPDRQHVQTL